MREAVKLTPLTPEEQTFAEENYEALVKAMRTHHLSNDMYDVAAMGFLHAVKKWFARPDLRQWSFQTIVNKTVWSKLSGEREREKRRIQTVSLDEVIPGTDGLTYGTIITDANISYLRREESRTMKINFDVKIPEAAKLGRVPSVEIETVLDFLDSAHRTLCFEYETAKDATKKAGVLRSWKKDHNRTDINIYKMADRVFIEKIVAKGRRKANVNEDK